MRLSKSLKQLIQSTARDAYAKGVADGEKRLLTGLKAVAQLNGSFGAVAPLAGFARKAEPDDSHALLVSAMLQVAEDAAESGDDPTDALRALADLSQDPDRLRDVLGGMVSENDTGFQKAFDESLHPRDRAGRFISKDKLQAAKSDPKLAAELRERVAPKDADKLEAVLSGGKDPGRSKRGERRHQSQQKRAATESDRKRAHQIAMRAFEPGGLGYDDYEELADLLPSLTVEQLRSVRAAVGASWGGQKLRRQGMVDTLVAFARQQAAPAEQDAPGSPGWQARMMNREPQPKPGVDAWESAKVDDAADRAERMGRWESDRPESEAAGVVAGAARADLAGAKEWAGDVAVTTPKPAAEVEPQAPPEEKPAAPGPSPLNTASPHSLAARDGDRRGHLGRVLAAAGALAPQDALDYATADGDRRVTAAQAEIILSNRLGLGTAAAARAVLGKLKPVGTTVVGGGRKRPTYDVLDLFRAVGKLAEPSAGNNPESGHTPSPPVNSPVAGQSGPDTGGEPNGRGQRLSDEVRGGAGGRGGAGVGAGDGPSPGDAPRPPGGSPAGEPAPAGGRPGNRGAGGGPGGGRPGGVAAGGAGAGGGPGGRGPAGGAVPPADGPGGGGGPGRADGGGEVAPTGGDVASGGESGTVPGMPRQPHEMTRDEYEERETAIPKEYGAWNDEVGSDRYAKRLSQTDKIFEKVVKQKLAEVTPGAKWPFPPVVVSRTSGPYDLKDGHHRIEVAKRLGMRLIPAVLTDQKAFGHTRPVNTFVEIGDDGPRVVQPNNEALPAINVTVPETRPGKKKPDHGKAHRRAVVAALAAGKPVPPEVLKDYPDLKPANVPLTPAPSQPAAGPAGTATAPATTAGNAAANAAANAPVPTRWHVTPVADAIRREGFAADKGGGIGGPDAGKGVSVWADERQADEFHRQVNELEEVRHHPDPLGHAVKLTNLPVAATDRLAALYEQKMGRPLTPTERAVVHVNRANSPYIPAEAFFGDGPRRMWQKLGVSVRSGARPKSGNDREELYDPADLAAVPDRGTTNANGNAVGGSSPASGGGGANPPVAGGMGRPSPLPALTQPTPYGPQAVVSRGGLVVRDGTNSPSSPVDKPSSTEYTAPESKPSGGKPMSSVATSIGPGVHKIPVQTRLDTDDRGQGVIVRKTDVTEVPKVGTWYRGAVVAAVDKKGKAYHVTTREPTPVEQLAAKVADINAEIYSEQNRGRAPGKEHLDLPLFQAKHDLDAAKLRARGASADEVAKHGARRPVAVPRLELTRQPAAPWRPAGGFVSVIGAAGDSAIVHSEGYDPQTIPLASLRTVAAGGSNPWVKMSREDAQRVVDHFAGLPSGGAA